MRNGAKYAELVIYKENSSITNQWNMPYPAIGYDTTCLDVFISSTFTQATILLEQ